MKTLIINLALAATLAASQPHGHGHEQFHRRNADNVDKRDVQTVYVPSYVSEYELDGETINAAQAEAGISKGLYVVVGETTPTLTTPSSSSTATPTTSSKDGIFLQESKTSTTTTPKPTTTSAAFQAADVTTSASQSQSSSSGGSAGYSSGATGIGAEFPDGEIDCSEFPSAYGAQALEWLGTGGWSSLQYTSGYTLGDSSISNIVAGTSGQSCKPNGFCSYSCPAGYLKSQWPSAQGSTGQSVGGLYCNSNGKLQLTRSSYKTLCQPGCGGVTVKSELSDGVAICRTDYPGSEAMTIPLWLDGGASSALTNVESSDYYVWEGKKTTLQYYINPKGVSVSDGCVWNSPTNPSSAGNWAPTIIGVGKDSSGITYISIFPNTPTSSATLDFDIEITGDISGTCTLKAGQYSGSSSGCTVGLSNGGNAVITFKNSS